MTVRVRLTLLATTTVLAVLVVGAFALTAVLSAQRVAALDQVVRARAEQTAALVAADRVPATLPVTQPGEVVQVLDASGAVLASSANASMTLPLLPATELDRLRPDNGMAVATSDLGSYDGAVRVAVTSATYRGAEVTVAASVPLGEVQGLVAALRVSLFGVVPVLVGVFALVVWYLLGATLAPVEQLRAAAADIARTGGPGALPVGHRTDELGALARTLNEMLDRLDAAGARQRRFVADAAHELRTPLAALRTQVEVAAEHPTTTSVPELADDLHTEVLRLQRLVDDLLVLARVGATAPGTGPVDLAVLAGDVVAQVAGPIRTVDEPGRSPEPGAGTDDDPAGGETPEAEAVTDGAQVTVTGAGTATGLSDDITRVLRNLVDNAVRHASSAVQVHVHPGQVDVDDDGPGIAADDRERVFERFVRLDDARHRDHGGCGLGLSIARELARQAGGDVVLSDSPPGGLRATVRLPV
ncbi:MAG: HAMP domain-containing histidine kinase [Micrococcales bacterium]|nr:HAMP domain-containing histidine kinase [Micrococcales bacterium]MCL2666630.1 HAMP domain-containing histidine kinase [Micrococcales bacterium]